MIRQIVAGFQSGPKRIISFLSIQPNRLAEPLLPILRYIPQMTLWPARFSWVYAKISTGERSNFDSAATIIRCCSEPSCRANVGSQEPMNANKLAATNVPFRMSSCTFYWGRCHCSQRHLGEESHSWLGVASGDWRLARPNGSVTAAGFIPRPAPRQQYDLPTVKKDPRASRPLTAVWRLRPLIRLPAS